LLESLLLLVSNRVDSAPGSPLTVLTSLGAA
jgi:hypothetical protein